MFDQNSLNKIAVLIPTISDIEKLMPRQVYLSDEQEQIARDYVEANAKKSWALRNPTLAGIVSLGSLPSSAKNELAERALDKVFRKNPELAAKVRGAYNDQAKADGSNRSNPSVSTPKLVTNSLLAGAASTFGMLLAKKMDDVMNKQAAAKLTPFRLKKYFAGAAHRVGGKGPLVPTEALDHVYGGKDLTQMSGSVLDKMRAAMSATQKLPKFTTHRN